jgi:hypothetical protein
MLVMLDTGIVLTYFGEIKLHKTLGEIRLHTRIWKYAYSITQCSHVSEKSN